MTTSTTDRATLVATIAANSELVDLLDAMFPEQSANPEHTDRQIWMQAGAREVVRKLKIFRDEGLAVADQRGLPRYRVDGAPR